MLVRLGLAKVAPLMAGTALMGGGAVHVAEQAASGAPHYVKHAKLAGSPHKPAYRLVTQRVLPISSGDPAAGAPAVGSAVGPGSPNAKNPAPTAPKTAPRLTDTGGTDTGGSPLLIPGGAGSPITTTSLTTPSPGNTMPNGGANPTTTPQTNSPNPNSPGDPGGGTGSPTGGGDPSTPSGGSTPVPAPSMLVLFGGAVLALMWRRRQRAPQG